jgi:hypothetical protein
MAPERSPEDLTKIIKSEFLMHQKTLYEQTITGKLEQLPLPDMSEAIWSRIENLLDVEMPTDNNGHPPAPSVPPGAWIGGGLAIFLIALINYFFTNKQPFNPSINQQEQFKPNNEILIPAPQHNTPGRPENLPFQGTSSEPSLRQTDRNSDTALLLPTENLPVTEIYTKEDTSNQMTKPLVETIIPPLKDSVSSRKSKGVTGITDDDYRIVPKKDSSR